MAKVTRYGITAEADLWRGIGARLQHTGDPDELSFAGWEHYVPTGERELLIETAKARGLEGGAALAHVEAELRRRREQATSVASTELLAQSIRDLGRAVGEEGAEAFVQRLPERLRAYAEKVLRS